MSKVGERCIDMFYKYNDKFEDEKDKTDFIIVVEDTIEYLEQEIFKITSMYDGFDDNKGLTLEGRKWNRILDDQLKPLDHEWNILREILNYLNPEYEVVETFINKNGILTEKIRGVKKELNVDEDEDEN